LRPGLEIMPFAAMASARMRLSLKPLSGVLAQFKLSAALVKWGKECLPISSSARPSDPSPLLARSGAWRSRVPTKGGSTGEGKDRDDHDPFDHVLGSRRQLSDLHGRDDEYEQDRAE
jgi:hypothetical protein